MNRAIATIRSGPNIVLLGFALIVTVLGLGTVFLAEQPGPWPASLEFRAGVIYVATVIGIFFSFRFGRFKGDQFLLPVIVLLSGFGLIVAVRLQADLQEVRGFQIAIGERQLAYLIVGLLLMWAIAVFFPDPTFLAHWRYSVLFGGILLLLVTAAIGTTVNGARLWISIGGVQIQTAELVKVALVVFLAAYLSENEQLIGSSWKVGWFDLPPIPYLAPMVAMWGLCLVALVLLNDLGTALLFFLLFLVMLYVASGRSSYVLLGLVAFVGGALLAYYLFDRVQLRIQNWIDPWQHPYGGGYQQIQSDYAISSGGIFGVGPGKGQPWQIPEVQTDYVVAVIGEEWGLIGVLTLLGLYAVMTVRGMLISLRAPDSFLRLMAVGLTASLAVQALVILCGVFRLLPLTGVTTPFVSYGGSSLLVSFGIAGLLLRISDLSERRMGARRDG
ncbi:MAG TPA: FtsW/RodA/SpoVE family cell cycle protein [Thermomicrobiales bacterium]|nr:FtsW/RodA/SpoVE family cell cycle protein [Thermomicrobiales bacterium]